MVKKCNNCGFQQNEFLKIGGKNYCVSCNSEIIASNSRVPIQAQKTAHQLKLALGNLRLMLEPLEGFIEKAYSDYYPNFKNKKQLYGKTIQGDHSLENFEETFLTQLLIMKGVCKNEPEFFRNEIKKEYYKWVELVGIDVNNCPEKLKHWLFEINEVLEDRGEKIVKEKEEKIKNTKLDLKDVVGLFRDLQNPLNKNREERENYKGRNWNELGNENRFEGSGEKGQEVFNKIFQEVAPKQESFSFYPPQQKTNSEIIQDIIQNPKNWRIDEIITGYSNVGKNKEEIVLIHRNARLDDYNQWTGELNFNNNPIYKKERFSNEEWTQIESVVLGVSQISTNQAIRWDLVNNIKQRINEFKVEKVLVPNENNDYDEESWIIHNSAERKSDKNGSLVFDSNNMFKVKDLTEAEQKELGIQHSDQAFQTQTDNNRKGGSGGAFGGYGSSILWGSFSVISLIGLAFTKK